MIKKTFLLNYLAGILLFALCCTNAACRSAGRLQSPASGSASLYEATRRKDSLLVSKYAALLQTAPALISRSLPLYRYIDRHLDTPFSNTPSDNTLNDVLLVQRLYAAVYHRKTPGTYEELYQSKLIPKFTDTSYLAEGDLLFFEEDRGRQQDVKHVGIYLQHSRFLSCTPYSGGVAINDLTQSYWQKRYKLAGRLR